MTCSQHMNDVAFYDAELAILPANFTGFQSEFRPPLNLSGDGESTIARTTDRQEALAAPLRAHFAYNIQTIDK